MASMLNDTVSAAKNVMETAREGAEHAIDTARQGTEHAVSNTRSSLLEAVHAVTGLVTMLRSLDGDDALGWVGLSRRRGPLASIAIFGAGMVAGAGVGMLLAPMSGADLRKTLLGRANDLKDDAKGSIDEVAAKAKDVEGKVEDLAGKAGDAVKKAEQKVETKVTAGAEAVKDAVAQKVDAATSTVKDAVAQKVDAAATNVKQAADDVRTAANNTNVKAHTNGPTHHHS
jgi:gas vesicle protein